MAALLPSVSAHAQNVWGGPGSTTATSDYNLGTNWPGGAAPVNPGQRADFDTTGSPTVVVTSPSITLDTWVFYPTAQSFSIGGGDVNMIQLGNNANAGQTITISNNLNLSSGGSTLVAQSGASTLILSGHNTFSGGDIEISAGTLVAAHSTAGT